MANPVTGTNPILEAARQHFNADEPRCIEVPEWGDADGQPLELYAKPITLANKQTLHKHYLNGGLQEMYVHALILKAQTADGQPAFTLKDKRGLMNAADPAVIERIAQKILASASEEVAEKN